MNFHKYDRRKFSYENTFKKDWDAFHSYPVCNAILFTVLA